MRRSHAVALNEDSVPIPSGGRQGARAATVVPVALDGFWLVSQAAQAVTKLLDGERRGIVVHPEVIPLWNDTPEKTGRDCRAYYRRSEKTIYVLWGVV